MDTNLAAINSIAQAYIVSTCRFIHHFNLSPMGHNLSRTLPPLAATTLAKPHKHGQHQFELIVQSQYLQAFSQGYLQQSPGSPTLQAMPHPLVGIPQC